MYLNVHGQRKVGPDACEPGGGVVAVCTLLSTGSITLLVTPTVAQLLKKAVDCVTV